jgi:hypothetical protein
MATVTKRWLYLVAGINKSPPPVNQVDTEILEKPSDKGGTYLSLPPSITGNWIFKILYIDDMETITDSRGNQNKHPS